MRQKLTLITLGTEDFEKSVAFYEQGLGWQKSAKSVPGLAIFPLGGINLALHPRADLAEDVTAAYQPSSFSGITFSFNARSEAEVDEVMAKVASLGAEIVKPAQKVYWGGYSGYYRDLDGYLFEVAFNPYWELDENGNPDL